MDLEVFGYRLHSLPDAIADDQEEEAPAPEVGGERIVEALFVDRRVNRPHGIEQRVTVALEAIAHLALHIGRRPATEFFGVVEDLAHDLASCLRIAPELTFDQYWQAGRRDQDVVDGASGRVQFSASRHRAGKHLVYLGDR